MQRETLRQSAPNNSAKQSVIVHVSSDGKPASMLHSTPTARKISIPQ